MTNRKVMRPRWPINTVEGDPPSATFCPRYLTHFNCRTGHLFLRKWRGLRIRGPGWRCKRDKAIDEAFRYLGWKP